MIYHMKPTYKSMDMNAFLSMVAKRDRVSSITTGVCVTCDTTGITSKSFRNAMSVKEYRISGMCQPCQDSVFGVHKNDDLML